MKTRTLQKFLWIFPGAVIFTWMGCFPPHFESINQPESANLNSTFEVEICVEDGYSSVDKVLPQIGLQLPPSLKDLNNPGKDTPYRLIFGVSIPLSWSVDDSISFTGIDEGIFAHSEFLSGEMTVQNPPPPGYYWWVSETIETMDTAAGQVFFTPVITTSNFRGNFFINYSVGHWQDTSYYTLTDDLSSGHLITCGLEDTVYVFNTANEGPGSLRAAVDSVNGGGIILFDLPLPATIHLTEEIVLYKNVTIQGPETCNLVISGNDTCRIFNILPNKEVHLSGLQIVNGNGWTGGGILCSNNTRGSMTNLVIRNNTAEYGGGIYFQQSEIAWNLSDVTISYNLANNYGGGLCNGWLYGDGNAALSFDSLHRCSIFSNVARLGSDIYLKYGCNSVIYLDTFSVVQPNDYWVWPQELFAGFDIQHFMVPLLDQDVYVSPSGHDSNTGTSPQSPFKTICHAIKMTYSDPQDPKVIHLAAGTYSEETNGETFPLYANSHIKISGQGRDISLISGGNILVCKKDVDFSIDETGLTYSSGAGISIIESDLSFQDFKLFNAGGINCSNSTLSMEDGTITAIPYDNNAVINAYSSSAIDLTGLHVYNNAKPLIDLVDSHASFNLCVIENNELPAGSNRNQMINMWGSSRIELSQSTIKNNISFRALTFSDHSSAWFDPVNRCNIYNNSCSYGRDINAEDYDGTDVIQVILDTFSVVYPTDYFAYPLNKFSFDILHGNKSQIDQNYYVSLQGSDENSGLTQDDPLRTITMACQLYYPMDDARDTIFLAEGDYGEGEVFPVFLSSGITIAGASCISTSINGGPVEINNKNQVALKDIRITNSNGYGLQVSGSEVSLQNCKVTGCESGIFIDGTSMITGDSSLIAYNDYGIYISDASVTLNDLLINYNLRFGMEAYNSTLDCYDLEVAGNGTAGSTYASGGFRASNCQVNIQNSVFEGNHARNAGGAMSLFNSGGMLISNLFADNTAEITGGAFYCNGSPENLPLILVNNLIEKNKAQNGGAIYYEAVNNPGQPFTLCGTRIRKNNATDRGGGIFIAGGEINLMDCRIEGNLAGKGGGICFGGDLDQAHYLSHSTIAFNKADYGGGVGFENSGNLDLAWDDLNRCNIYLNRAKYSGHDLYCSDSTSLYPIVVDTFTLLNPGNRFAHKAFNFEFDILNGCGEPGDNDLYVSPEGSDLNSGVSFDDPLKTMTRAMFRASLDTIWPHHIYLAEGVYSASTTGEDFPVEMWEPVEVIGQGPGLTVVDGEHAYRLIVKNDRDTDVLRNMSLVAGSCTGDHGGAILSEGSGILELENIVLDTNTAYKGGAVYSDSTSLKFNNVMLSRNTAHYGAGIYSINSPHLFKHVTLSGNISPYGYGGGAYVYNCIADWNDVVFTGNSASYGGGLYIINVFENSGYGTSFTGNQASNYGGAINISSGLGTARNMSLVQNRAKNGGAIRIGNSNFYLSNMLLAENETMQNGKGAAIYAYYSDLGLDLVTMAGNLNPADNSGYMITNDVELEMKNLLCWGNIPDRITVQNSNSIVEVAHCDLQGGQESIHMLGGTLNWLEGNIDADPLFAGAGDYPYQLTSGSPCIDAGTADTTGLVLPLWDLMGNYRLWDGNSDGDTVVDMGAYEFGSMGVGIKELQIPNYKFQIELYPNPASGEVFVSVNGQRLAVSGDLKLSVCDMFGREVKSIVFELSNQGELIKRMDVSDLPSAVYLVRVQAGGESAVRKLVIR
jgi:hypothetical protein